MLAFRLPREIEERPDRLANATECTKTFHPREAILEHLDVFEDLYRAELRLSANRAGRPRMCPLEEAGGEVGLEH